MEMENGKTRSSLPILHLRPNACNAGMTAICWNLEGGCALCFDYVQHAVSFHGYACIMFAAQPEAIARECANVLYISSWAELAIRN